VNVRLKSLSDAGVSIWLDDLSRQRIQSGQLAELIADYSVSGVTTNPTIFAAAFQDLSLYGDQLSSLKDTDIEDAIRQLMSSDVHSACQIFAPLFESTKGYDGRVSIEVAPTLAMDTAATIEQAALLADLVAEPNVLVKIPATKPGLPAITATIAAGISVNVTLIFSLQRYLEVMDAYLTGLEQALANGIDVSTIHSVASFFVSRMDSEVDKRLDKIDTEEALALRGKAAVANARLAYAKYLEVFERGERFASLKAKGANVQRPLWASTGTKNADFPDTLYVDQLIASPTVNTMPEKTMLAFADHGEVPGDTITGQLADAEQVMTDLAEVGIDYDDVVQVLEDEGVQKFVVSWDELVEGVSAALAKS